MNVLGENCKTRDHLLFKNLSFKLKKKTVGDNKYLRSPICFMSNLLFFLNVIQVEHIFISICIKYAESDNIFFGKASFLVEKAPQS